MARAAFPSGERRGASGAVPVSEEQRGQAGKRPRASSTSPAGGARLSNQPFKIRVHPGFRTHPKLTRIKPVFNRKPERSVAEALWTVCQKSVRKSDSSLRLDSCSLRSDFSPSRPQFALPALLLGHGARSTPSSRLGITNSDSADSRPDFWQTVRRIPGIPPLCRGTCPGGEARSHAGDLPGIRLF